MCIYIPKHTRQHRCTHVFIWVRVHVFWIHIKYMDTGETEGGVCIERSMRILHAYIYTCDFAKARPEEAAGILRMRQELPSWAMPEARRGAQFVPQAEEHQNWSVAKT